ncbi:hypothetical protein GCK72_003185 [Caenorhabditis remanei]|uniref:RING-type domain-containing protein n=1 Tax=Caenorhabditis remanei TaxID=31234 RepID=A0A6A5HUC8_CAERE|nr:hypothetical protein GCK72_003185 [Caenorhabditis remanei]KAF1771359.1 hypothetical protein GCK72_003185 [Caenorhabditis remanei]
MDARPRCNVCHEPFHASPPTSRARIFACGHSTCSGCIDQMRNLRNLESERLLGGDPTINRHMLKCPQCRKETPMFLPKAEKMLRNFAVEQQ